MGEEEDGRQGMACEVGRRDAQTFGRLYARLPDARKYRRDGYSVYRGLPSDRHPVGKAARCTAMRGHAVWRGQLHRWVRSTQGYSQSAAMRSMSLALLWGTEGGIPHINTY